MPRFGVGLHGISGHRLRVVPAEKVVELVYGEDRVASQPFTWEPGSTVILTLAVKESDEGGWMVVGTTSVVADGGGAMSQAISIEGDDIPARGKASIWGTPYAGLPIYIWGIGVEVPEVNPFE